MGNKPCFFFSFQKVMVKSHQALHPFLTLYHIYRVKNQKKMVKSFYFLIFFSSIFHFSLSQWQINKIFWTWTMSRITSPL